MRAQQRGIDSAQNKDYSVASFRDLNQQNYPSRADPYQNSIDKEELSIHGAQREYGDLARQEMPSSIPRESGERPSVFQQASQLSIGRKGRLISAESQATNEYFEKNFGNALERKRVIKERAKEELVSELQNQIVSKAEEKRRKKMVEEEADRLAEQRYLNDLKRMREGSAGEKKRQLIQVEGVGEHEARATGNRRESAVGSGAVERRENPVEDTQRMRSGGSKVSFPGQARGVVNEQSKSHRDEEGAPPDPNYLSEDGPRSQTYGGREGYSAAHVDSLAMELHADQVRNDRYMEYATRMQDYSDFKADEKRRELRMNTNLLYQQLVDLRGEKAYTDNLKNQAVQSFDNVRRNIEKQNQSLARDIGNLVGPREGRFDRPERVYNAASFGRGEEPDSRAAEFRRQGLVSFEPRQGRGGEANEEMSGEGTMLGGDTRMVPIKYEKTDPRALEQIVGMNEAELGVLVRQEGRREKLDEKYRKEGEWGRREEMNMKNMDFGFLVNEMVRECREIYEEDIGLDVEVRKGKGETDILDMIIENLYNDDFKANLSLPKKVGGGPEKKKEEVKVEIEEDVDKVDDKKKEEEKPEIENNVIDKKKKKEGVVNFNNLEEKERGRR